MATYKQISYGSSGDDVKELQTKLNQNGANLAVDGQFGSKTLAAVKNYQKANGLDVDGIVGNNTWGALNKVTTNTATKPAATTPATTTTATTTTTPQWSYADFELSDAAKAAGKNRQTIESQKPGEFTYQDYVKSAEEIQANNNLQQHLAQKPGEFTYQDYVKSAEEIQANNNLQQHLAQKPGEFTYQDYVESDAVAQAKDLLNQHLAQKPGEYQSAWQSQIDDTINKILNREKFSYDLNGDALYQQYKDQYTLQGQQAMMDTMGQAAAMTGGYGNSYAQTVGQQTYQGYLQQLNDKVPELYKLALDQYNREGDDLYNQYGLFADRENQDYGRYRDTVGDWKDDRSYLADEARYQSETDYNRYTNDKNFAYGQHRDTVTDWKDDRNYLADEARYQSETNYNKYIDGRDFAYGQHRDTVTDWKDDRNYLADEARYQSETNYNKYTDNRNFAYGQHRDTVSDWQYDLGRADDEYWNMYDNEYGQYSDNRSLSYDVFSDDRSYDYTVGRDAVEDEQWQKTFDEGVRQYNADLAEKQRQFNVENDDDYGDDTTGKITTGNKGITANGNTEYYNPKVKEEVSSEGDAKFTGSTYAQAISFIKKYGGNYNGLIPVKEFKQAQMSGSSIGGKSLKNMTYGDYLKAYCEWAIN